MMFLQRQAFDIVSCCRVVSGAASEIVMQMRRTLRLVRIVVVDKR